MSIIAIMNEKGGVGKTTSAINLAFQASLLGKTLILDCDPQSNLSLAFDLEDKSPNIYDLFLKKKVTPFKVRKNLFVIPSTDNFFGADLVIQNELSRESILKKQLDKYKNDYKHIFIDCPPSFNLITINALTCADYVLIPIKSSSFSISGVEKMIKRVLGVKDSVNTELQILGLLLTHFNERLNLTGAILEEIEKKGWSSALFKTKIRLNTAIGDSQLKKKTIYEYNPKSNGAMDYAKLSQEIFNRIKNGI
jgi:chromosome partitioning protein